MRLIDIHEEVEKSNVTREELLQLIHDTVYSIPSFNIPVTNGKIIINVGRAKILTEGLVELGINFTPIEPECNENMFKEPLEYFIKELLQKIEDTVKRTDPSILSGIHISIDRYIMFYKEGIINFVARAYLDRADSVSILSDVNLLDAITNLDSALYDHVIPMDRLPRFEPGYGLAMDKAIKRMSNIYKAYQKGKFKDKPYELGGVGTRTVSHTGDAWDPNTRTIYPNFVLVMTQSPHITYDGDKTELIDVLKKKFKHFDIEFQ